MIGSLILLINQSLTKHAPFNHAKESISIVTINPIKIYSWDSYV